MFQTTKVYMSGTRSLLVVGIVAFVSACELKEFKNAAWQQSLPSPLLRPMPCMMHHDVSWCIMMYHDVSWCIMKPCAVSWCIMMFSFDQLHLLPWMMVCFAQKGAKKDWHSDAVPGSFNHKSSILPHCEDDYAGSLIGGAIGGIVLGLLMIILVSLPLCCGILKQYGKARKPPGWKSSVFLCSFCPDRL